MFFQKNKKEKFKAVEITDANFQELVMNSEVPVLLDFWAPWCGPCRVVGPIVDELAEDYQGTALVGKVNVDQNPGLSQSFNIKSIPTMAFIKNNKVTNQFAGMVPKPNLAELLDELINEKVGEAEK